MSDPAADGASGIQLPTGGPQGALRAAERPPKTGGRPRGRPRGRLRKTAKTAPKPIMITFLNVSTQLHRLCKASRLPATCSPRALSGHPGRPPGGRSAVDHKAFYNRSRGGHPQPAPANTTKRAQLRLRSSGPRRWAVRMPVSGDPGPAPV